MIPGIVAQESTNPFREVIFGLDVIFQSTLSGTHGGTDAVDLARMAPLTFNGAAILNNTQSVLGLPTSLLLQGVATPGYVSVPANVDFNIGSAQNFTVECAFRTPSFAAASGGQIVGVWNNATGQMQWRWIIDSTRLYLQVRQSGVTNQYSFAHSILTNTWYWMAVCRDLGVLRTFLGPMTQPTAEMVDKRNLLGTFDALTLPLTIGGSAGGDTCNAFIQMMRITRNSQYKTDDPIPIPTTPFGTYGPIQPELVEDFDTIYAPQSGQVVSAHFPADTTFPVPVMGVTPTFTQFTSPSVGTSITSLNSPLTTTFNRAPGDVIITFIQTTDGGKTFSIGAGWTIGGTSVGANSSAAWAYHTIVDDADNASPPVATWSWSGATNARTRMYTIRSGRRPNPVNVNTANQKTALGQSTNILVDAGVGITTTDLASTVFAFLLLASSNQTIPTPSGFTAVSASGNLDGSDLLCYQRMGLSGAVSNGINVTITSAKWHAFLIELKKA